jgi:CheY-like chemotaxis protein
VGNNVIDKKPMILVVDDSELNRRLTKLILGTAYDVRLAADGMEALRFLRTDKPDLILLDLMMPNISGIELTKILKAEEGYKDIPIFMITASVLPSDKTQSIEAGVDEYMTKPIDIPRLRELVAWAVGVLS